MLVLDNRPQLDWLRKRVPAADRSPLLHYHSPCARLSL